MVKRLLGGLLLCTLAAAGGVAMYSKTETKTYAADTSAFANAAMGYAPAIGDDNEELASLRYLELTWRQLEPEEGSFDWDGIEEKYGLDELRSQGIHLVFRLVCDKPGGGIHLDIPDWLYHKTDGDGSWYLTDYGYGYSPNYSNEVFRSEHAKALAAISEHLGQDGFVSYVELGSLGHWGEWHIKPGEGLIPMPKESIRDEYVQVYMAAFPASKLLMRRPFNIAAQEGLGLFNDMTGAPGDTNRWLGWIENGGSYEDEPNALTAMPDFWLTAPAGGEFTSSTSMEEMLVDELPRTLELIEASHMSFIGPKIPSPEYGEGYEAVLGAIGYRLRVTEASLTRSARGASLELTFVNDGAAPFYWDWDVNVYVENAFGLPLQTQSVPIKLSSLAPGTRQSVEVSLPAARLSFFDREGTDGLRVYIGIIDPMTGKNAVRLAMDAERTEDGCTVLFG